MTSDYALAIVLLVISALTPTTVFFLLGTSSQAAGVAFASAVIVLLAVVGITRNASPGGWAKAVFVIAIIAFSVLAHGLVSTLFEPVNFGRALSSIGLAIAMGFGAFALSRSLFLVENFSLSNAITSLFAVLVAVGAASIVGIQPPGGGGYFKSVFPFTEPSHYALTLTPVLIAFCVNQKLVVRVAGLVLTLALAYLLESLSLVVGVMLAAAITLPTLWLGLAGVALVALIGVLDITYFTDRLDLSSSSGNLSALVYLQGWDLAGESLRQTRGWGVGFQQLGVGNITSYTSSLITLLAGTDVNLRDGGFTLAKMIAEFGIFGGLAMSVYAFVMAKCAWTLRMVALRLRPATAGYILALSFVSGYAVEAFVRGVGYFSGTALLTLASILFLQSVRNRRRTYPSEGF